jgi:NAD(P)-dependent dehydrogenase (short-subunit alcohol dehydrogenase family)
MSKSKNNVAIVTGSASGVGAATCVLLAKKGWNVVINYSRSEAEAKATEKECASYGAETLLVLANVAEDRDCRSMVDKAVNKWGRIDALINNAGRTRYCSYGDLDGLNSDDFLELYRVNVVGAYQMARAASQYLKESDNGSITNTTSISGRTGVGSSIAYAATKGALSTLTKSLAVALGPEVRVNAVCPGFIQGRWTKSLLGNNYDQVREKVERDAVLGISATPEDIARTIAFLVCIDRITTGQEIVLDGGSTLEKLVFK